MSSNNILSAKSERNPVLDVMKGLGMLLVIIGHSNYIALPNIEFCRCMASLIYSFHMPMFFILSGYLFKVRSLRLSVFKDISRLIVPYIITSCFCIFSFIVVKSFSLDFSYVPQFSVTFICGYGPVIWFLVALFFTKTLYHILVLKIGSHSFCFYAAIISLSLLGFLFANKMTFIIANEPIVPLSIAPMLTALFFFAFGHGFFELLLRKTFLPFNFFLIFCYFVSSYLGGLSMFSTFYPYLIINIFGAIGGSYLLYIISQQISIISRLEAILSWIGRNSLLILCVHCIDFVFGCRVRIYNESVQLICMLIVNLALAYLLSKIKFTRFFFA